MPLPALPPLTRFCGPDWEADPDIRAFLTAVDPFFAWESEQHPVRRWEYAMALLARACWLREAGGIRPFCLDVGGAGSPLVHMLRGQDQTVELVDPALNTTIEAYSGPRADCLFSISVIEHVEDVEGFLEACVRALKPGGLLFLTMDAWDPPVDDAPDRAHFHWERKRIFSPSGVEHLFAALHTLGCLPFGGVDLDYKGNALGHWGYTFASLAAVKEG